MDRWTNKQTDGRTELQRLRCATTVAAVAHKNWLLSTSIPPSQKTSWAYSTPPRNICSGQVYTASHYECVVFSILSCLMWIMLPRVALDCNVATIWQALKSMYIVFRHTSEKNRQTVNDQQWGWLGKRSWLDPGLYQTDIRHLSYWPGRLMLANPCTSHTHQSTMLLARNVKFSWRMWSPSQILKSHSHLAVVGLALSFLASQHHPHSHASWPQQCTGLSLMLDLK